MKYEKLSQFLAGYFNQDFALDGEPDEIIKSFVEDVDRAYAHALAGEIDRLLEECIDEASLRTFWNSTHTAFDPTLVDSPNLRTWLLHVKSLILA